MRTAPRPLAGASCALINTGYDITPGSRAGLEPRSGRKSVAVQPIVKDCSDTPLIQARGPMKLPKHSQSEYRPPS